MDPSASRQGQVPSMKNEDESARWLSNINVLLYPRFTATTKFYVHAVTTTAIKSYHHLTPQKIQSKLPENAAMENTAIRDRLWSQLYATALCVTVGNHGLGRIYWPDCSLRVWTRTRGRVTGSNPGQNHDVTHLSPSCNFIIGSESDVGVSDEFS